MADVEYLSAKHYLAKPAPRLLDIGSQCLYHVVPATVRRFMRKHGGVAFTPQVASEVERISYHSTPRPDERTTYLSELLDLTSIEYISFDVCPALKTEIFDLNVQALPQHYQGYFDVILNCGTTEHVINQMNCLRVMHDALAVEGVMLHQVPTSGYTEHGYFCYHEAFFRDFANANGYVIDDLWYSRLGGEDAALVSVEVRNPHAPLLPTTPETVATGPSLNINVVLRKTRATPMQLPLELATAHAAPVLADAPTEHRPPAPTNCRDIPGTVLLGEVLFRVRRRLGLG